jgi:Fe2+ transport system protein FeoA
MQTLNLFSAPYATPLKVVRAEGISADAELILDQLGLYAGAALEKLHAAPLGDPITVRLGSQSFALQKALCCQILVEVNK